MVSRNKLHIDFRRGKPAGGFTLVEVMLAALIMVLAVLGTLSTVMMALHTSMEVRYRDRVRNVVKSIADEFQSGAHWQVDRHEWKTLFIPTTVPTGTGMCWDNTQRNFVLPQESGGGVGSLLPQGDDANGLIVYLDSLLEVDSNGLPAQKFKATIRRQVDMIDATGAVNNLDNAHRLPSTIPKPNFLLRGVFTATYSFPWKRTGITPDTITLTRTVVRNINPSDP